VGLFGAVGDHEVVDTPGCIVLSPVLARVLAALRRRISHDERDAGPLAPHPGLSRGGSGLLAIDVREVRGPGEQEARALVTLVVVRGAGTGLERLRAAAVSLRDEVSEVLAVAVNFHDGESPQVLGAETLPLLGPTWASDVVGTTAHRATFGSFVQAHRGQAARIHDVIRDAVLVPAALGARVRVLDLYGGSGAIALTLAVAGADVTLVESFGPAVEQVQASASALGVKLTALNADVALALSQLARRRQTFDAAIVNPPRRGLDPAVRMRLAELDVRTLVYVSCQPETLARDLDHLARLGFAATELLPFDMIPLTHEVETVAILRRAAPREPVVLFEDEAVIVVDKAPHEPTTPQGEHTGSLLARVQKLPGCAHAVPVHRLDVGTSGVVIFAKDARHVEAWGAALQADGAAKTYVAAVRGSPDPRGVIDRPLSIDGKTKSARTRFERTASLGNHALLEVAPEEGRTHQIRRHLAAIGHPVLGDARYGHAATNRFLNERYGLERTFLHAARLELRHPTAARRLVLVAPLPGDLRVVLDRIAESSPRRLT